MGSVVKRGSTWYAVERINGKQKWFCGSKHGFSTERGAKQFLARLTTVLAEGDYVEPSLYTFAQYADHWLESYAKRKLSNKTLEVVRYRINGHLKKGLGKIRLRDLRATHIEAFYATLVHLSPSTQKDIHATLVNILNHAVEMDVLPRSPVKRFLAPKVPKREAECYSVNQVEEILRLLRGHALYNPIVVAIFTGMRIGELCALKWEDVNEDTITICRSLEYTREGGLREKGTKTGDGRTISISSGVVAVLAKQKGWIAERRLKCEDWKGSNYVFPRSNGVPHIPQGLSREWAKFISASHIPYKSWHCLRHTHASLLIADGEHPFTISKRLGHSSIQITMDRYGHLMKGMDAGAANRLERLLANG